MNISGAGDSILEYVENDGCCITFANIVPAAPTLYGLVGTILGHRYPKKPVVTNIPITPSIDIGANAASDDKRHKGKTIIPVMNNIDACRDCKKLDNKNDVDVTVFGLLLAQNPTIP